MASMYRLAVAIAMVASIALVLASLALAGPYDGAD